MHFSIPALTAAAGLLGVPFVSASTRIFGVGAPKTIAVGESFNAILAVQDTSTSVVDISTAFGLGSAGETIDGNIGYYIQTALAGDTLRKEATADNITVPIITPSNPPGLPSVGGGFFTAGVYSLEGEFNKATLNVYRVAVERGNSTSDDYNWSWEN